MQWPLSVPLGAALKRRTAWLLVLAVVLFVGLIRLRVLGTPLERDEGEYAYAGQLLLQGIPPYRLAYNMKLPGVYFAYAAGMAVFGQTLQGIHWLLLVVNAATIVLVFLLGRELFGQWAGVAASAVFGVMSVSSAVLGQAAHANHFVILFAVPAAWLLWRSASSRSPRLPFLSGLLFGTAFLMKQQAVMFALFGAAYFLFRELRLRPFAPKRFLVRCGLFLGGLGLPILLVCLYIAAAGVFSSFWFWVVLYARQYIAVCPWQDGLEYLRRYLSITGWLCAGFRLLALLGLLLALGIPRLREQIFFLTALLLCSFAAVAIGLYFRPHYFILALPATAILAGAGVACLGEFLLCRQWPALAAVLPGGLLVLALGWNIFEQRAAFFQDSPLQISQANYPGDPFVQSLSVAQYIREHSRPTDTVGILGSEPQIYFYSGRHSVTGYIYTFPLMEPQPFASTMRQEMIGQIENGKPAYLVFVGYETSWGAFPDSDRSIFAWFENYSRQFYHLVGVINRFPSGRVVSRWDEPVTPAQFPRQFFVAVYKRNIH